MRRVVKRAVGAGVLAGVAYGAWRAWQARRPAAGDVTWETAPFPFPPVPRPAPVAEPGVAEPAVAEPDGGARDTWVEPLDDGACPVTHPVKGKVSSGIYHVPGGANYERTHADRCYLDPAAAEADGLRPSKR